MVRAEYLNGSLKISFQGHRPPSSYAKEFKNLLAKRYKIETLHDNGSIYVSGSSLKKFLEIYGYGIDLSLIFDTENIEICQSQKPSHCCSIS